jgi:tetratricopeptide (TPR) repeat protein
MKDYFFRYFFLFFSALILFSCSPKNIQPTPKKEKAPAISYYYAAISFIESQQFDSALAKLDTAIARRPNYAQFHFARGQVLELLNRPDSAITAFENALKYKSYYPEVWKMLANLYMQQSQYEKAIQTLRNMVDDAPDSLSYLLKLAEAYLYNGQPRMTLDRLNYFRMEGGDSPQVDRLRGLAYLAQKDYQKAVDYLEKYVSIKKPDFRVLKALGIAYINTGELERGMSNLNAALTQEPNDPGLYLYRAEYFIAKDKLANAMDQYNYGLQLDSTSFRLHLEKGKLCLIRKDTLRAKEEFLKAVKFHPQCWECYKYLGIIEDDRGNTQKAMQYFQEYLKNIYSRDPDIEQRLERLKINEQ